MQKIFLILFFLSSFSFYGQTKKTSIYFDNDKSVLGSDSKIIIDKFASEIENLSLTKILVLGNTDNSSDSAYNFKLSKKRTEAVVKYLSKKNIDTKIVSSDYFGENKPINSNETDEGKQKNRRVDIIVYFKKVVPKPDTIIQPKKPIAKIDTCRKDTTIILSGGTIMTFNKCEFLSLLPCLEFEEATSADNILASGMTLMDGSGLAISSCGMLKISLKPGCSANECFKTPVKVRFAVPKVKECDYCGKNAKIYIVNKNGRWGEPGGKKTEIKKVKINGEEFYQLEVYCANIWQNCDCKTGGSKVKFQTQIGYKLVSLKVVYECPVIVVEPEISKNRKNLARAKLPCPSSRVTISGILQNKLGDTLYLNPTPINDLSKKLLFARCSKTGELDKQKFAGIFKFSERKLYRKYFIKPKNLVVK